jgi:hypothetical protein
MPPAVLTKAPTGGPHADVTWTGPNVTWTKEEAIQVYSSNS